MLFPLKFEQMSYLEGFAGITDKQLTVPRYPALMYPEYPQFTRIGINTDFEHMGQCMPFRIRGDLEGFGVFSFALQKLRWVSLHGIGHQPGKQLQ